MQNQRFRPFQHRVRVDVEREGDDLLGIAVWDFHFSRKNAPVGGECDAGRGGGGKTEIAKLGIAADARHPHHRQHVVNHLAQPRRDAQPNSDAAALARGVVGLGEADAEGRVGADPGQVLSLDDVAVGKAAVAIFIAAGVDHRIAACGALAADRPAEDINGIDGFAGEHPDQVIAGVAQFVAEGENAAAVDRNDDGPGIQRA